MRFPWRMYVEFPSKRLKVRRPGKSILQNKIFTTDKQFGGKPVLGAMRGQIRNTLSSSCFRSSVELFSNTSSPETSDGLAVVPPFPLVSGLGFTLLRGVGRQLPRGLCVLLASAASSIRGYHVRQGKIKYWTRIAHLRDGCIEA